MEDIKKTRIIHLDMDAFYASIEERDNPQLKGKPVIVGAEPGVRGVVSTCNYEARKYGVRSAMSSAEAYRRCPNGIFVPCHFSKYKEASDKVHEIMLKYTDCIEFLSLDEGYMDVTGSQRFFGSAENIAKSIQEQVFKAVNVTCSVGVGYNMLSAKLASEEKKPRGFFIIDTPDKFRAIMFNRPVGILYGVGKKTAEHLNRLGIKTVGDLANTPLSRLSSFGVMAQELLNYANGIDNRNVTPNTPPKSIGKEHTFLHDISDISVLKDTLLLLSRQVSDRLKVRELFARTVTLKIKYSNMQSITRSNSDGICNSADEIYQKALRLLNGVDTTRPIRLIGVSLSNFDDKGYEQMTFSDIDNNTSEKIEKLDSVVTEIRKNFGRNTLKTAREILAEQHLKNID